MLAACRGLLRLMVNKKSRSTASRVLLMFLFFTKSKSRSNTLHTASILNGRPVNRPSRGQVPACAGAGSREGGKKGIYWNGPGLLLCSGAMSQSNQRQYMILHFNDSCGS